MTSARALGRRDVLLVTEVYAAGEPPIAGADGRAICRAVRSRGQLEPVFVERVEELAQALRDVIRGGDVVVAMGAGNISAVAHQLPRDARRAAAAREARMSLALAPEFSTRVRRDEPLSRHTSWHVGGPARGVLQPARPRRAGRVPAHRAR